MKKELPIIALDFEDAYEAMAFVKKFEYQQLNLKIGMELYYASGPQIIQDLTEMGHEIFLDLKLYDIPNTVERSMMALAKKGVSMINVHAIGGKHMMEAAMNGLVRGTRLGAKTPLLIAVTQLTSTTPEMLERDQLSRVGMQENILHLANLTQEAGLNGVVCSPLEAGLIKEHVGDNFLTVTPGIRLQQGNVRKDDQKRIATPFNAAELGSDYIVVGRPITRAENPVATYESILADWQAGRLKKNTEGKLG
ncbi:orotidine-5'-phosphate decarboxylase [Vaginisenegalia massiliensis]|uniref:orotidine-5'-phosphate decarboxylase n=1 Tax=Vaginisenegalia massiliensis TaxID=2058294 RepID=UPI000F53801E|nr:orotidine-5'-phosphate decarboxylase [Vaginisenegalia massiliensis]